MTITSQWVEPIDAEHHDKIITVFHKFFINKGGKEDGSGYGRGYGDGYGDGNGYGKGYGKGYGDGYGDGRGFGVGNVPEEWRME